MRLIISLVALVGFACTSVQACMNFEQSASFVERVGPALDLARAKGEVFYFRFGGTVDELNELVNRGRARSTESSGREPVFASFAEARRGASRDTTFVIGVSRSSGEVSAVFTVDGEQLTPRTPKGGCSTTWR